VLVIVNWFTVADFLHTRSNVYHYNYLWSLSISSIVAAVDSNCKKRQKTFSFTVSWQKQIKLYVSSQKGR